MVGNSNTNRFETLSKNEDFTKLDEEINFKIHVGDAINSLFKEIPKSFNSDSIKDGKSSESSSSRMGANCGNDIGQIIAQVLNAVQPLLVTAVVKAFNEKQLNKAMRLIQTKSFRIDELEQYTRKDNLKFDGLQEEARDENVPEDTTGVAVKLANDIGVPLTKEDICSPSDPKTTAKRKTKCDYLR